MRARCEASTITILIGFKLVEEDVAGVGLTFIIRSASGGSSGPMSILAFFTGLLDRLSNRERRIASAISGSTSSFFGMSSSLAREAQEALVGVWRILPQYSSKAWWAVARAASSAGSGRLLEAELSATRVIGPLNLTCFSMVVEDHEVGEEVVGVVAVLTGQALEWRGEEPRVAEKMLKMV